MKRIFEFILYVILRCALFLRYRIKVVGKETLIKETLSRKGGILFLANHPAEIDPCILLTTFWFQFKPHPIAVEYLFRKPIVRGLLDFIGALPVPNFDGSSNSYKKRQIEKTYERIYTHLDKRENFLIYPAGGLKNGPEEVIGGSSGVQTILEARPETNIVLIRTTGLWGSSFSRAPTGKTPDLFKAFLNGLKVVLRNCIFFVPKRNVTIECCLAPKDFPRKGSRIEINRYLEKWYNANGSEPLSLVSFSCFKEIYPAIKEKQKQEEISLAAVPEETKQKVIEEIVQLTRIPKSEVTPESHLALDLGLDSLDISQLVVCLKEDFGISSVQSSDLTTVGSVFAFAARLKTSGEQEEEELNQAQIWGMKKDRPEVEYPEGNSVVEVFLKTCERMDGYLACVDQISGEVSYKRLKMGVILLAKAIQKMSGERIGIMMPASVAVNAVVLATILAGKIPVMINWTLGERNLRSIVEQSGIAITLSSWSFLDRLDNVDVDGIDDQIILLEEVRRNFSIFDKLKAFLIARKRTAAILKRFGANKLSKTDPAVILFTSGTESFPKGVPLSHENLMTNHKAAQEVVHIRKEDILLGALPPFHSFGFSVTGLFPLLIGLRAAYYANPTDGRRMAQAVERWQVTMLCLAPTFLKNMLRVATKNQLSSLHLVVTGAEKTAAELFDKLAEFNPQATLIEGYGITECAPILTLNPPENPPQGVGKPLPGVTIEIVHPETLEPVPVGKQGLILARGANIFQGYLDPHLASPFVEYADQLWYQTGDLGYLDANGYLTLSGRLKRFVKIGGEMVSLTAIEETLLQSAQKQGWELDAERPSLAVCALEEEGKKSEMHLFTTFETTSEEVNQVLREGGMSNIIKVRSVKKRSYIPVMGSGKVDYRRLSAELTG